MISRFRDSVANLRSVRTMTLTAILIALALVVEMVTRPFSSDFLKITFTFLPFMVICMLFGPVVGAVAGALIDFIGALLLYGSINPLLLIVEFFSGILCGLLLFGYKNSFWRCILTRFVVCMILNTIFATLALAVWNGMSFAGMLALAGTRALKNLALFAIEGTLLYFVLKLVGKIYPKHI